MDRRKWAERIRKATRETNGLALLKVADEIEAEDVFTQRDEWVKMSPLARLDACHYISNLVHEDEEYCDLSTATRRAVEVILHQLEQGAREANKEYHD